MVAAVLGGGVLGASSTSASGLLGKFAPFSGSVWDSVNRDLPDEVTSEYGSATLRYDDDGVQRFTRAAKSFALVKHVVDF